MFKTAFAFVKVVFHGERHNQNDDYLHSNFKINLIVLNNSSNIFWYLRTSIVLVRHWGIYKLQYFNFTLSSL